MPCVLTQGFTRDCNDGVGGIEEVYLINRDLMTDYTLDGTNTSLIATITAGTWYRYELKREVGNIASTTTVDPVLGTRFADSVVAFSMNKFSATKTNELKIMVLANLAVICKDNQGVYWGVGFQQYANGTSLVANTGTAFGDRNGYDISLTAKEPEPPFEIPSSVILLLTIDPAL